MKDKELEEQIEELAAIEHERWADWQRWCNGEIRANANDIESPLRRWDKQIETPYEQLSEREKDSDREQVRRYLPIMKDLIAQERRKAKIEVYEELKPPKEFEQFSRLTGGNPCTICGFDPIALIGHIDNRLAELKEDKEA